MDVVQFEAHVSAWEGSHHWGAMEMEYKIVLIGIMYVPVILIPIVYFSYLGDTCTGAANAAKGIYCYRKEQLIKEDKREEEEAPREVDLIFSMMSNILLVVN